MKKLLLMGICSLLITRIVFAQSNGISLNGYLFADAKSMVARFNTNNALQHKKVSVWFSADVIKAIVAMVGTERGPNREPIDGFRMYFATTPAGENTLIMVSTYQTLLVPGIPYHTDYFYHNKNNPLYSLADVHGVPSTDDCHGGALLYRKCSAPGSGCPTDPLCTGAAGRPHYNTHQHCEDMVSAFSSATYDINDTTKNEWFPLCLFTGFNANMYDGMRFYYSKHLPGDATYPGRINIVAENTVAGATPDIHIDKFDCNFQQCDITQAQYNNFLDHIMYKDKLQPNIIIKKPNFNRKNPTQAKQIRQAIHTFFMSAGFDEGELCPLNCQVDSL